MSYICTRILVGPVGGEDISSAAVFKFFVCPTHFPSNIAIDLPRLEQPSSLDLEQFQITSSGYQC